MDDQAFARAPSPRVANFAIAVMCIVWGSTWIVIKSGLRDLPPQTSGAARFWIAGIAMAGLARALRRVEGGVAPPTWLWLTLGTLNFGVSYGIVYRTETLLPSGLVSLLWGVFPMLSALAGHVYLRNERLAGRQWAGFALGLLGLAILFRGDLAKLGPGAAPAALVLFLSPIVSVVGNTLVKRYGAGVRSLALNRNAMFVGAAWLTLAAFALEKPSEARWTPAACASVAYLSLMGTVLTFGLYFWLMRYTPANKLSLIAYVTPAVALFLGAQFGGEEITASTLGGAGAILAGILLVVVKRRAAR